jgi:hypothetical protein
LAKLRWVHCSVEESWRSNVDYVRDRSNGLFELRVAGKDVVVGGYCFHRRTYLNADDE